MTIECLSAKMRDFCNVHRSIRVALTQKLITHIKIDVPQYKWIWDLLCKISHLIINQTPFSFVTRKVMRAFYRAASTPRSQPQLLPPNSFISCFESKPASRYLPLSITRYLQVYIKLKSRWAWRCRLIWKLRLPGHGLALRGSPQLVKWVWKYENLVSNIA